MREPISKREPIIKHGHGGKNATPYRKEVAIKINKSGKTANGTPREAVCIRFTYDAIPKISSTDWCAMELDREEGRLYFRTASAKVGFKLSSSSKSDKAYKSISLCVANIDEWREWLGDYDLKKDVAENLYYIDLPKVRSKK